MSGLGVVRDRRERSAGLYAPSPWPAECGGSRRQKAADGGLTLGPGRVLRSHARTTGLWNVMVVRRDPGELFLTGVTQPGEPRAHGWLERIDPVTLEALARSPALPSGGHVWCGATLVLADGSLLVVHGSFAHRLDASCRIEAARELPVDAPYNGAVALQDGTVATKDLQLAAASSLSVLEPDGLTDAAPALVLPEPSMGRIAADRLDGADVIVVPGTEHLFKVVWDGERLTLDDAWRPRYRAVGGGQGLAWDTCLSDGAAWLHDNGDITMVRAIHAVRPAGSAGLGAELPAAVWPGAQRLLRVDGGDPQAVHALTPFGAGAGWVIAPPVHVPEHDLCVCFDTGNGRLAAVRGDRVLWEAPIASWMQPLVFPDAGQLVVDDWTGAQDDLVVLDLATGTELGRVDTGSPAPNGMFLTPGEHDDVLYCSNPTIARVWSEAA